MREFKLNIDPAWLLAMAEKENGCCISVRGPNWILVTEDAEEENGLEVEDGNSYVF